MFTEKQYLVIWQLSDNEQSRENTPIDVEFQKGITYSAKQRYDMIVKKLKKKINQVDNDYVTIVGIFKL